ncbi:hypothetical protein [Natronomonas sp.]|jgi:hypothetical protein|uniref:DUF7124 domain-containing protein n=1 Tax=Natronomonas sp. TaxID=2184060 RepID=UPI0039898FFD
MTDSINLDEISTEEEDDEQSGNEGDWLWRDDEDGTDTTPDPDVPDTDDGETNDSGGKDDTESVSAADVAGGPAPGVPTASEDPVGVPGNAGRSGGHSGGPGGSHDPSGDVDETEATSGAGTAETHGAEEPDDMTMALTYKAAHHVTDPAAVLSDANGWADWIGIVGEVSTPVIRKFQRDNRIELDFFGGSESGPEARLQEIDRESMFYADRMVLVGTDADEWIAEDAGWEFVPIETAAEKAGWDLREDL